jgi:hypothetical protein
MPSISHETAPGRSRLAAFVDSPTWRRVGVITALLLVAFVGVGLFLVRDYGASWDEPFRIDYARESLRAYIGQAGNLNDEKGPFFGMIALAGAEIFKFLPGWRFIDGWHFMNFLSFGMGLFFFYRLCRRLVTGGPALGATLLFASQPLLWGHAFINPKDIPFMAFFLACVSLGLDMVDGFEHQAAACPPAAVKGWSGVRGMVMSDWQRAAPRLRRWLTGLSLALVLWVASRGLVLAGIAWVVNQAYTASSASWLGALFARLAHHASSIPMEAYAAKGQNLYNALVWPGWAVLLVVILLVGARALPVTAAWLLRGKLSNKVLVAGAFLGLVTAVRSLGPAAGGLVGLYFLLKSGRKALPTLLVYAGIGIMVAYLCWPALWSNPQKNFTASFNEMANFDWIGQVTFAGVQYDSQSVPRSFVPVLMTLQFTETGLALIAVGFILGLIALIKKPGRRLDMLLLGAWFCAPVVASMFFSSTQYDNFRHLLFVVPPLFILAALSLQAAAGFLNRRLPRWRPALGIVLLAAALLPGLYWDVQLHPYEYIYYNALAGGPSGAFRRYELDYWATAYKESIEYLNRTAPQNAVVTFGSTNILTSLYARADLSTSAIPGAADSYAVPPQYAVLSSRNNSDRDDFPDAPVIYTVRRAGAVLAVVKQLSPLQ